MGIVEIVLMVLSAIMGIIKFIASSPMIISAILTLVNVLLTAVKFFWKEISKALRSGWVFFKEKFEYVMDWIKSLVGKKAYA